MTIVYKADPVRGAEWSRLITDLAPDLDFRIWPDIGNASDVKYLITWEPPENIPQLFPNLQAVFSTGAGVDQFDMSRLPDHIPLVRMIESGIIDGMVEYVTMSVLALHRNLPAYLRAQAQQRWEPALFPPAHRIRVGVLGLGVLGQAVIRNLQHFGYTCMGWSRSGRAVESIPTFGGNAGLKDMLAQTDILVCLLPLTTETQGFLNAKRFGQLPRSASLVHVGRGGHLIEGDLLEALDTGHLAHAIVDVTPQEPLPADNPLWSHPNVWITPHIASITQPETAVQSFIDNVRRIEANQTPHGLVDRSKGY